MLRPTLPAYAIELKLATSSGETQSRDGVSQKREPFNIINFIKTPYGLMAGKLYMQLSMFLRFHTLCLLDPCSTHPNMYDSGYH